MKSNTLQNLSTSEIERQLSTVQELLLYESFGSDHEAYYELAEERVKLFRELKRRKIGS